MSEDTGPKKTYAILKEDKEIGKYLMTKWSYRCVLIYSLALNFLWIYICCSETISLSIRS